MLLGPADVRAIAAEVGLRPTKRLGQNFVVDANTVRRIVRVARPHPTDVVLEVGPGLGSLTLGLLPHAAAVIAVEIDPVLADALPRTVSARAPEYANRLTVVEGDALSVTVPRNPTLLVANLPYNVAVPVVLTTLERVPSITRGLVMVQAEVAARLTAKPGSRVYGVPSVKLAWWTHARAAGPVSRSVFWPVPNVDSALVAFERTPPPDDTVDRTAVFAVIDAAFAGRRKTLRAALTDWAGSSRRAEQVLVAAGIDPSARGETLTVADFARIASTGRGGAPKG